MSLDYEKIEAQEHSAQTSMSSYSDLFAALGFVFLFLYVMSMLQTNLQTISSEIKMQKVQAELKTYEIMPAGDPAESDPVTPMDYKKAVQKLAFLEQQAKEQTEKFYQHAKALKEQETELLENYHTVIEHARRENQVLNDQVKNKEQQLLAQEALIKEKAVLLSSVQDELENRNSEIGKILKEKNNLKQQYASLSRDFDNSEQKLKEIEQQLSNDKAEKERLLANQGKYQAELENSRSQIENLGRQYREVMSEKDKAAAEQEKLEAAYAQSLKTLEDLQASNAADQDEIDKLLAANQKYEKDLERAKDKLGKYAEKAEEALSGKKKLMASKNKLASDLAGIKAKLQKMKADRATAVAEKKQLKAMQKQLAGDLQNARSKLSGVAEDKAKAEIEKNKLADAYKDAADELADARQKIASLQSDKENAEDEKAKLVKDRDGLLDDYRKTRDKLKSLEDGNQAARDEKDKLLADKKKLENELSENKQKLDNLEKEKDTLDKQKEQMLADINGLEDELGDYKEREDLRKKIIDNLKNNFKNHNIEAEINEGTGEVTLPFNKAHFDLDSSKLREDMKGYLKSIIPVYTGSIFGESTIYKYIHSIEIVGYASPIYQGKYVDPRDLSPANQQALHYNMSLSYRRAHSIFKYIINNMKFDHQKDLALYLKVTGRSYLESEPVKDLVSGNTEVEDFCETYDCEKLQSAAIRFNLVK